MPARVQKARPGPCTRSLAATPETHPVAVTDSAPPDSSSACAARARGRWANSQPVTPRCSSTNVIAGQFSRRSRPT